jgi:hypothetical protein
MVREKWIARLSLRRLMAVPLTYNGFPITHAEAAFFASRGNRCRTRQRPKRRPGSSACYAGRGSKSFAGCHPAHRAIFAHEQPVKPQPLSHPRAYGTTLTQEPLNFGNRDSVLHRCVGHSLDKLTESCSEVQPNGRRDAFCFDEPTLSSFGMRAQKICVRVRVDCETKPQEMCFDR